MKKLILSAFAIAICFSFIEVVQAAEKHHINPDAKQFKYFIIFCQLCLGDIVSNANTENTVTLEQGTKERLKNGLIEGAKEGLKDCNI